MAAKKVQEGVKENLKINIFIYIKYTHTLKTCSVRLGFKPTNRTEPAVFEIFKPTCHLLSILGPKDCGDDLKSGPLIITKEKYFY